MDLRMAYLFNITKPFVTIMVSFCKDLLLYSFFVLLFSQYLQDESKTKRNTDLNLLEWTHYSMKPHEIPQQLNGSDCGMFTCKYADYISRDKPITFTQHQMPLFRKKMVWEILHQQLL